MLHKSKIDHNKYINNKIIISGNKTFATTNLDEVTNATDRKSKGRELSRVRATISTVRSPFGFNQHGLVRRPKSPTDAIRMKQVRDVSSLWHPYGLVRQLSDQAALCLWEQAQNVKNIRSSLKPVMKCNLLKFECFYFCYLIPLPHCIFGGKYAFYITIWIDLV